MGFNITEQQEAIVAQLKAILPNTPMFEDTIEDDASIPRDENGKLISYQIVRFGPMKASRRDKSFRGPRHDGYFGTVDVIAVASKGGNARRINEVQVDALLGFRPDGTNPMSLRSDEGDPSQFVVTSNEARPTQNVASTRMKFTINNKDVGEGPVQGAGV